ncbi:hypothetical protein [Nitriliruptor alkaliphilus]|uniref:hypothetical protein n=1 Tax=Nitriliruptor alkaliphilus TaxID=427918 RepID=UPI000698A922|nr:hypothetical protein [Nitriliruptor alkaliphilus]
MPELRDLLEEAAPHSRGPAPIDEIVRRGRRRSVTTRVASAAVVLLALVAAFNVLPSPSPSPIVDEPRPDEDGRPVGADVEVTMQPGFDGPAADQVAQRLDPKALPGTAEVVTWAETGLGRIDVVRYRTHGGEITTEEDGELYTEWDGPHCLAVTPGDRSPQPQCGPTPIHLVDDLPLGAGVHRILAAGGGSCASIQTALSVPLEVHEVVLSAADGGSVSVVPHEGLVFAHHPGHWDGPWSVALYDIEGRHLGAASLPDTVSSYFRAECEADARVAATPGTATVTVDGALGGAYVADHVRSLRWPTGPGDELRAELVSLREGVAVQLRVRLGSGDADRTRVELRLPTVDPAAPPPVFTASGDACRTDVAEVAERDVRGRIDCELVSEGGATITVRIDVEVAEAAG